MRTQQRGKFVGYRIGRYLQLAGLELKTFEVKIVRSNTTIVVANKHVTIPC